MQHFTKNEDQAQHSWWNQSLSIVERAEFKQAFVELEKAGAIKRGADQSSTSNMEAVLGHMLEEKPDYYEGKINSEHDATFHKYSQLYSIAYQMTKHGAGTPGTPQKTPTKIKICSDDELRHTDTHSSTRKTVQPQTCQVHLVAEDKASSQHEESESPDKMQNITIFSKEMDFQQ